MKGHNTEDILGVWSGSFSYENPDGQTKEDTVYLVLKRADFAGSFGPTPDDKPTIQEFKIHGGKVEGDKITFEVLTKELFKVELALIDGNLKGEAKAEHEGKMVTMAVNLQRTTN